MGFPSVSEFIIDVFRALPQELSEKSSSLTERVSRGVVKLLRSINLLELMRGGWVELVVEWSEAVELASKLARGAEPSVRAGRYRELFERYYGEALRLAEEGDTRQAGEKIWGL